MAAAAHAALPASCKPRAAGSAGAAQGRPLPSWPAAGAEHAMLFQPSRSDEVARRTPSTATTDDCELGSLRSRRRPPAGCLASIPTYVFSRSCTTFAWCARLSLIAKSAHSGSVRKLVSCAFQRLLVSVRDAKDHQLQVPTRRMQGGADTSGSSTRVLDRPPAVGIPDLSSRECLACMFLQGQY